MKKGEIVFLEVLVLSLIAILISATMTYHSYSSTFEMRASDQICLEQQRENPEFRECIGQNLVSSSIALKFGSIRNTITANGKALPWSTRIFSVHPGSVNAQISFQYLPRASPLPELIY